MLDLWLTQLSDGSNFRRELLQDLCKRCCVCEWASEIVTDLPICVCSGHYWGPGELSAIERWPDYAAVDVEGNETRCKMVTGYPGYTC